MCLIIGIKSHFPTCYISLLISRICHSFRLVSCRVFRDTHFSVSFTFHPCYNNNVLQHSLYIFIYCFIIQRKESPTYEI